MQTNAGKIKISKSIAKSLKGTKGGKSNLDKRNFITVWDAKKRDFRAVNLATLTGVRMSGFSYNLEEMVQ